MCRLLADKTRKPTCVFACKELAHKTLTDWSSANNENFKDKHCELWVRENSVLYCKVLFESGSDSIERHA